MSTHSPGSPTITLAMLVSLLLALAGCQAPASNQAYSPGASAHSTSTSSVEQLVEDVASPDPAKSVAAVQEVLERAGFPADSQSGGPGHTAATVSLPADAGYMTRADAVRLAMSSAAPDSGITLPQMANMLKAFGWPFPEQDVPASIDLGRMLDTWLRESTATEDTDDPLVFGGKFLSASATKKAGGGELPRFWPPHWRLTPLEVLVFTSSFLRANDEGVPRALTHNAAALFERVPATGACTEFRKSLGNLGEPGKVGANAMREAYIKAATKKLANGKQHQDAIGALSILEKLRRLSLLYTSAGISIEKLAADPIHRRVDEVELVGFKAVVGVDEEQWKEFASGSSDFEMEYSRNVKDCMSELGLPTIPSVGDIAASISDWRVEWDASIPDNKIARISLQYNQFDQLGQFQHKVRPVSAFSGETPVFTIDLTEERKRDHDTGGRREMLMNVEAHLETSAVPSLQTFVGAAGGGLGLADSIVELMAGFYQEMHQPTTLVTTTVEYHEHENMRFKVDEGSEKLELNYRGKGVTYAPPSTEPVEVTSSGRQMETKTFPAPGTTPQNPFILESLCGPALTDCPRWDTGVIGARIESEYTAEESGPNACSASRKPPPNDTGGFGIGFPGTAGLRADRVQFYGNLGIQSATFGASGCEFTNVSGIVTGEKEAMATVDGDLVRSGKPFTLKWTLKGSFPVSGHNRSGTVSYTWTKSATLHRVNIQNDLPYNPDCIQIQVGDCNPR